MSTFLSPEAAALAFLTPMRQAKRDQTDLIVAPDRMIPTPVGDVAIWQRGDGTCVLLIHGWSGAHDDLNAFVAPLLAAGRQVISMDLPAHGHSAGEIASLPDLAVGILHVARAIGPVAGVIAHSVGCAATGLALQGGMEVARVALIAPPSRYADFARSFAHQAGVDPEALLSALRNRDIDMDSIDYAAMAPSLRASAMVIHSKDDQVVPFANGKKIAAAWPNAQFIACEGLGHRRILTDPDVISAAVMFVTN
jgi:pimeloyl-ACP methyl ester carboxylesterase